jgi:hypothetical protein
VSTTLGQDQRDFARLVPRLIDKAHELGFRVTLGDAYRDPRVFGQLGESKGYGHRKSGHKQRLAIDLNLFVDVTGAGNFEYVTSSEGHRPLGEWWEQQDPRARWGGRFSTPDGNHYSFFRDGVM